MSIDRTDIQSLAFEDMSFAFEGSGMVFESISIELPKSKAVWIRSPGGRGKSTLLKILSGLLTPQSGRYLINGMDVNQMSFEDFQSLRLNIGYGFDFGGLINNRSVAENLSLQLQYHKMVGHAEGVKRVDKVIEQFGMQHYHDLRPFAIPGSQRKLTCVLRALIHHPQVVFLDDPLIGLKADSINDLFNYIEDGYANRGLRQVFFTSERPEFAERFKAEEVFISEDYFTVRTAA